MTVKPGVLNLGIYLHIHNYSMAYPMVDKMSKIHLERKLDYMQEIYISTPLFC